MDVSKRRKLLREAIAERIEILERRHKDLEQQKKELSERVERIQGVLNQFQREMSSEQLATIISEFDVRVDPDFPVVSFVQRLTEQELRREMARVEGEIAGIYRDVRSISNEHKTVRLCPDCGGEGGYRTMKIHRQGGTVTQQPVYVDCELCEGSGEIDVDPSS
jgi:predicted ribosome quality control (RQC) complex YloA/Tae2 family protein